MEKGALIWRWLTAFREVNQHGRNFSGTHMGILFSMATRANPDGTGIYRGTKRVAQDTGTKADTVTAALKRARALNVIERVGYGNSRKGLAAEYRLTDPLAWRLAYTAESPYEPPPF